MATLSYLPLESNPDVFTGLIHRLGVSEDVAFHDVLSLDDPDLLAMVPRPVLALVLAFPAASPGYISRIQQQERDRPDYDETGDSQHIVWFRQTIHNACGLYGILHAVSNGAPHHITPGSALGRLLDECKPLRMDGRARALEADEHVAAAHETAALQGVTEAPASPEAEVNHHYVCFARSPTNGCLYELDGDRKGPVRWADLRGQDDLLAEPAIAVLKDFIRQGAGEDATFSLLALAPSS